MFILQNFSKTNKFRLIYSFILFLMFYLQKKYSAQCPANNLSRSLIWGYFTKTFKNEIVFSQSREQSSWFISFSGMDLLCLGKISSPMFRSGLNFPSEEMGRFQGKLLTFYLWCQQCLCDFIEFRRYFNLIFLQYWNLALQDHKNCWVLTPLSMTPPWLLSKYGRVRSVPLHHHNHL